MDEHVFRYIAKLEENHGLCAVTANKENDFCAAGSEGDEKKDIALFLACNLSY
jgi:hypothetical protein